MKKFLFSAVACFAIASFTSASNLQESVYESKILLKKGSYFNCAGEVNVIDRNGVKVKTYILNGKGATNHFDCLSRYLSLVAEVEKGLNAGEHTEGSVWYI